MKKIISVILCIFMLIGAASTCISALDYFAGEKATAAPTLDGTINDGEYSWTSGKINAKGATKSSPIVNKLYASVDVKDSLESLQYFISYDDEYIYVAYMETGTVTTEVWFDLNPRAGMSNSQGQIFTYVVCSPDGISRVLAYECTSAGDRSDQTAKYVAESAGLGHDDGKKNTNHIELKFKRSALEAYAGAKFDKLGFRSCVQRASGAEGEIFYADEKSESKPFWFYDAYGHHIINLNNNGENPDVNSGTVTVDGLVSEGEYVWSSDPYDRNVGVGNEFFVMTPHTDDQALTAQFFMNYDGEYLYIAYKERGGYETPFWFDINPCAGKTDTTGQLMTYIKYTRDNSYGANNGVDVLSLLETREYSADGKYNTVEGSKYITEAMASWFDDGMRNNNTIEIKVSVAALEEYAGADVTKIGFRGILQGYGGEAFFSSAISPVKPIDFHPNRAYHVFSLNGKNNVTKDEFELDASHVHNYDGWTRYSETQHSGMCTDCGMTEYDFHEWDPNGEIVKAATETAEGKVRYTCTVCGATDEDVIPMTKKEEPATEPVVTEPAQTAPAETEPADTEPPVDGEESGCGSTIATISIALVASLGICTVFAKKRR